MRSSRPSDACGSLYHQYASGQLDSSTEVSAELVTSHMSEVTTSDNRSKIKFKIPPAALTMVSGADENLVIYFMWPYVIYLSFVFTFQAFVQM